jgi:NAD(P)-dependent dehydrogenase (short-subunit alcohol dehydrogenase family)
MASSVIGSFPRRLWAAPFRGTCRGGRDAPVYATLRPPDKPPPVTLSISFAGRHAVVTGGASGIGLAIARRLKGCGAAVTILDIDGAALKAAAATEGFAAREADVSDGKAMRALAAAIDREQPADIVVAAAGVLQRPLPAARLSDAEWSRVTDTNLKGAWLTLARFGEATAARGAGALLAVGSVTGSAGTPLHAYGPAKAALMRLVEGLAAEWASRGVRVNAVAPGFVATPALELGLRHGVLDAARLAASAPAGRLVALDEVADAAAFLLSDLASGITGATLPVDAGLLAAAGWGPFGGAPGSGA